MKKPEESRKQSTSEANDKNIGGIACWSKKRILHTNPLQVTAAIKIGIHNYICLYLIHFKLELNNNTIINQI